MISIVINADTRVGYLDNKTTMEKHNSGCRSLDFLVPSIANKRKFFTGFDTEVILFVDEHEPLLDMTELRRAADILVVKKHDVCLSNLKKFTFFNDFNLLQAMYMATGDYICHFDGDCAAFTYSPAVISNFKDLLETFAYVSYPTPFSPRPYAESDLALFDHIWACSRFLMFKRQTLDFTEVGKCLLQPKYMYQKYGEKKNRCAWLEHVLGIVANSNVFYPPLDNDKYLIFCWNHYYKGLLESLNSLDYAAVQEYIGRCDGIQYPCDVRAS